MEMFELRYFVAVAKLENIHRASEEINVSPASLSKAISRLESELQTPLFSREGRNIRLTPEGTRLKQRALEILHLEEDTRQELIGGDTGEFNIYLSSEEVLQTAFGALIATKVDQLFPKARIHFLIHSEKESLNKVKSGEAHMAIVTTEAPKDLEAKLISNVEFLTCASPKHPLAQKKSLKRTIPIEEILSHPFVSPDARILGNIEKATSYDGWRDDKFPRQIKYRVYGLKMMENLIGQGQALGYLPDYFVEQNGLVPLKVSGCPYSCKQKVRLVTKNSKALGWLNRLWLDL